MPDQVQRPGLKARRILIVELAPGEEQARQQVVLAVAVTLARVAADAAEAAVAEDQPPDQLPEFAAVKVEPLGRIPAGRPAGEVHHRHIAQADEHVSDVEVAVVIERVVVEVIRADVPLSQRPAGEDRAVVGIGLDGDAVEQKAGAALGPQVNVALIGVHAGDAGEECAVPEVRLGAVPTVGGPLRGGDRQVEECVGLGDEHPAQALAVRVGEVFVDRLDAVHHPLDAEQ